MDIRLSDWDKLRIFFAVARAGSFTRAADSLHMNQSTLSRQISGLEHMLGSTLFHRHSRGLDLTEAGHLLYETAYSFTEDLRRVEAELSAAQTNPLGPLHISIGFDLESVWLIPILKEFCETYPDIRVTLEFTDSSSDPQVGTADVALRLLRPTSPHLKVKKLLSVQMAPFASNSYLEQFGTPRTFADLEHHRLIGLEDPSGLFDLSWLTEAQGVSTKAPKNFISVDCLGGVYRAVRGHLGIGCLAAELTPRDVNLVQLFPDIQGPKHELLLVYPEEMQGVARITLFRKFLEQHAKKLYLEQRKQDLPPAAA